MRFISRINLGCVNQTNGNVEKLSVLSNWKPDYSIKTILTALRSEMASSANRKLSQPAEGTNF
mgnify:CR=1 FL=1